MPLLGSYSQVVVLVATVRALKMHGGGPKWWLVSRSPRNTRKRTSNCCAKVFQYGEAHPERPQIRLNVVVAVNSFKDDKPAEVEMICKICPGSRRHGCGCFTHWMDGARRAALGEAVARAANEPSHFKFLYPLEMSIKEKIETVCRESMVRMGLIIPSWPKKRSSFIQAWVRQTAALHGQDPSELEPRPHSQGCTHWLRVPIRISTHR